MSINNTDDEKKILDYPLFLFQKLSDKEIRDRILKAFALELQTGEGAAHEKTRNILANSIQGFRNPSLAPKPLLVKKMSKFLFNNVVLTIHILNLWIESMPDLKNHINVFLDKDSKNEVVELFINKNTEEWKIDELINAANLFSEQFPDINLNKSEIAIALCDGIYRFCSEDASNIVIDNNHILKVHDNKNIKDIDFINESCGKRHSDLDILSQIIDSTGKPDKLFDIHLYDKFIEEIDMLSTDALEWEKMIDFIGYLALTYKKNIEIDQYIKIMNKFDLILTEYKDEIQFIELSEYNFTEKRCIEPTDTEKVRSICENIKDNLIQIRVKRKGSPTVSEIKEWSESIHEQAEKIRMLFGNLADHIVTHEIKHHDVIDDTGRNGNILQEDEDSENISWKQDEELNDTTGVHSSYDNISVETNDVDHSKEEVADTTEDISCFQPNTQDIGNQNVPLKDVASSSDLISTDLADDDVDSDYSKNNDNALDFDQRSEDFKNRHSNDPTSLISDIPVTQDHVEKSNIDDQVKEIDLRFWSLVSVGKIELAYQLARVLDPSPVPISVLRICILGQALTSPSSDIAAKLKQSIDEFSNDFSEDRKAIAFLITAGTLKPSLLAPDTGATALLRSQKLDGALYRYCQEIVGYGERLNGIDAADLSTARDTAAWEMKRDKLYNGACLFLQNSQHRTCLYAPATKVWQSWTRKGGCIHDILTKITKDKYPDIESIEELLQFNFDRELRDTQKKFFSSGKAKQIEARARDQLRKYSEEALDIVKKWRDLYKMRHAYSSYSYSLNLVDDLRHKVIQFSSEVLDEIQIVFDNASISTQAASIILKRSVNDLKALFDTDYTVSYKNYSPFLLLNSDLLLSELKLSDNIEPEESENNVVYNAITQLIDNHHDWESAFQFRIELGDFLSAKYIYEYLQNQNIQLSDKLANKWFEHFQESKNNLKYYIGDTRSRVERAMMHGLLSEAERSLLDSKIFQIEDNLDNDLRIDRVRDKLNLMIEDLDERRTARLEALRTRLEEHVSLGPIRERIEAALDEGDVLTAEEYLHLASQNQDFSDDVEQFDSFGEFFPEAVKSLYRYMGDHDVRPNEVVYSVRDRVNIPGVDFRRVPGIRAAQAAGMLEAWFEAKRMRRLEKQQAMKILEGLGFRVESLDLFDRDPFEYNLVTMPFVDRKEIPVEFFGSRANGNYRLLCFWGLPSEEELLRTVGDTNARPATIVFYFSRMTEQARRDLARLAHERRRTFIVVDEILMLYLCGERGLRLPVLFKCALPFTHLEPYVTTASLVPPEMFYGREREKDLIVDPKGSSLLYGGRQLGKTALLRHVERSYHAPDRGWIVRWIDFRDNGIGYHAGIEELWRIIAKELKDQGVIAKQPVQPNPDRIVGIIREWLDQESGRRILLLLDEADRFLEQDARTDFQVTAKLKGLMDGTDRRFKVVFAGLHNVLRTTHQSNHPLGHFGDPIAIGPLMKGGEVRAAQGLIDDPFNVLGFRFESADLVLRILAYTNYYPSLIQIFCQELLKHLGEKLRKNFDLRRCPPYSITGSDVDEAFSSGDLRDAIRQRFALTLQLDTRYEVIAYALAHMVLNDDVFLDVGVYVSNLRDEALYWWPDVFQGMSEEYFDVLLDEMVGLGVLRKLDSSTYTFRNANTLLLLGTLEEVERALIRERSKPLDYDAAHFRETERGMPQRVSPFTARQMAPFLEQKNCVTILIGSKALGLTDVFRFLVQKFGQDLVWHIDDVSDRGEFDRKLAELERRQADATTIVLVDHTVPWNKIWVEAAISRISRLRSSRNIVHVLFVATPQTLLTTLIDEIDSFRSMDILFLQLHRWHDSALRHWLEANNLPNDSDTLESIRMLTGARSLLLHRFIDETKNYTDWNQGYRAIESTLKQPEYRQEILEALGLGRDAEIQRRILQKMAEWNGQIVIDDLTDLMEPEISTHIAKTLRWAERLELVTKAGQDIWELDPFVSSLMAPAD